jgi:hypothetical protein
MGSEAITGWETTVLKARIGLSLASFSADEKLKLAQSPGPLLWCIKKHPKNGHFHRIGTCAIGESAESANGEKHG